MNPQRAQAVFRCVQEPRGLRRPNPAWDHGTNAGCEMLPRGNVTGPRNARRAIMSPGNATHAIMSGRNVSHTKGLTFIETVIITPLISYLFGALVLHCHQSRNATCFVTSKSPIANYERSIKLNTQAWTLRQSGDIAMKFPLVSENLLKKQRGQ